MSRSEKEDFLKRCRVPPEELTVAKVVETGVTPKHLHQMKVSKAIRVYNKVADAFINNELPMLSIPKKRQGLQHGPSITGPARPGQSQDKGDPTHFLISLLP